MASAFPSKESSFRILENLWQTEDSFTDVIFYVGTPPNVWRIPAHKMILSKCSSVFEKMFKEIENPSTSSIEIFIRDCEPDIFDKLLRCIYTNKIYSENVTETILLLQTSVKYRIAESVQKYTKFLCDSLNSKNVLMIYNYLFDYMDEKDFIPLQVACLNIIDKEADQVLRSKGFLNLKEEIVTHLTNRSTLKLSNELILFDSLLQWSQMECKRRRISLSPQNRRRVLGSTLLNVRFGLLDPDLLLEGPMKNEILTEQDKVQIFHSTRQPRIYAEPGVCRIKDLYSVNCDYLDHFQKHILAFTADRDIILTKVTLMGHQCVIKNKQCDFKLLQDESILVNLSLKEFGKANINGNTILLTLPCPVLIKSQTKYILQVSAEAGPSIKGDLYENPSLWCGDGEQVKIIWEVPSGQNLTTLNSGQLFYLHFIIPLHK